MTGYLILTFGGLLFGAMIYRYDMHEREPWWMLVLAVIAGSLGMWGAFELQDLIVAALHSIGLSVNDDFIRALLAGTLEESAKLAVPVGVLLLARKQFNDPMDGLIYGSLAGLGAGMFESAWWQWFAPDQPDAVQQGGATALRLFVHAIWGGIVGWSLGLIVIKKPWRRELLRSVGLIMLIHFAWDFLIGFSDKQNNLQRLVAAGLIGGSVVWYGMVVVKTNKWSRAMHAPKSKQRLAGRILRALITRRIR